jgi:hypothetical protein
MLKKVKFFWKVDLSSFQHENPLKIENFDSTMNSLKEISAPWKITCVVFDIIESKSITAFIKSRFVIVRVLLITLSRKMLASGTDTKFPINCKIKIPHIPSSSFALSNIRKNVLGKRHSSLLSKRREILAVRSTVFHRILAWAHCLINLLRESNARMPRLTGKNLERNENIFARRSWQMASFFQSRTHTYVKIVR